MTSDLDQVEILEDMIASGQYDTAYLYIADQIEGGPGWDQNLPDWFRAAAQINGPEPNFLKSFVFSSNAIAAGLDPGSGNAQALNQQVSNGLAEQVVSEYINAIENDSVLSPRTIFETDVLSAVQALEYRNLIGLADPWEQYTDFPFGKYTIV